MVLHHNKFQTLTLKKSLNNNLSICTNKDNLENSHNCVVNHTLIKIFSKGTKKGFCYMSEKVEEF